MAVPPVTNTAALNTSNKKNQTKGSGFTNINSVLDANKGAGEKIGNKIGSELTNQASSVREGIQASQNQFNTQKNQAGQQANQAIQAGQALTRQAGETDDAYTARVAQGNQNFNQIGEQLRGAAYTGPTQLTNAGKLQAQGQNVAGQGQLAGNTQGQEQLLRTMVAKPGQYTRGQSALDQLLLGQSGQGAIQQGRRATLGLGEFAQGAQSQAEAQANALKTGISANKTKTINSLQDAITGETGLQAQARKQAETFQTDAKDLQSILAGTYKADTPEAQARVNDLLGRMGEFGLDNYNLYTEDENQVKGAIGNLANTLTTQFGASRFTDPQRQAGMNLATVLGDKDLNDRISNASFDTNVFGDEAAAFSGLDKERAFDTDTKNRLESLAGNVEGFENQVRTQNQATLERQLQEIDTKENYTPEQKEALKNYLRQTSGLINQNLGSFGTNTNFQTQANQLLTDLENQGINFGTDPNLGIYSNQYQRNLNQSNLPGGGIDTSNTGWSAFADTYGGEQVSPLADLDRFSNLGLNEYSTAGSGDIRSSAEIRAAGQRALAQDKKLKDFVLSRILGLNNSSSQV